MTARSGTDKSERFKKLLVVPYLTGRSNTKGFLIEVFMGKLLYGVGLNDADYTVSQYKRVNGKVVKVWACPFYVRWANMIRRCYSPKYLATRKNYTNCSVCDDWLTFSNFKAWMEKQDWQDKDLDKDHISNSGIYSPESCVFLGPMVNNFIIDASSIRGNYPVGVSFNKCHGKFIAKCNNPFTGKTEYLGYHCTADDAHKAWRKRKHEIACQLACSQSDERVANSLRTRYL